MCAGYNLQKALLLTSDTEEECTVSRLTRSYSPIIRCSADGLVSDVAHVDQMFHHGVKVTFREQQQTQSV